MTPVLIDMFKQVNVLRRKQINSIKYMVGPVIATVQDEGRGNLDCHWKMRVSLIGTEILPGNRPPTDPSEELLQGFLMCKERSM